MIVTGTSIEMQFVMVFPFCQARAFDADFSAVAVFNNINNSEAARSATFASFSGECFGEESHACVLMCF